MRPYRVEKSKEIKRGKTICKIWGVDERLQGASQTSAILVFEFDVASEHAVAIGGRSIKDVRDGNKAWLNSTCEILHRFELHARSLAICVPRAKVDLKGAGSLLTADESRTRD